MQYSYKQIFEMFKDRCSESCFHKIWLYQTYKNVGIEFNTQEVKDFYKHFKEKGLKSSNCKISKNEIIEMRQKYYINGESMKEISKNYNLEYTQICRIISGKYYNEIPIPEMSFLCKRNNKIISKKEILTLVNNLNKSGLNRKDYFNTYIKNNPNSLFYSYSLSGFNQLITKYKLCVEVIP